MKESRPANIDGVILLLFFSELVARMDGLIVNSKFSYLKRSNIRLIGGKISYKCNLLNIYEKLCLRCMNFK